MPRPVRKPEETEFHNKDESFGALADHALRLFGISKENMDSVRSILNMIKTTEYKDRTEIEIDVKKIKIVISK